MRTDLIHSLHAQLRLICIIGLGVLSGTINLIDTVVGLDQLQPHGELGSPRRQVSYKVPDRAQAQPAAPATVDFPTVNKCCPLAERWRDGKCSPGDFSYESSPLESVQNGGSETPSFNTETPVTWQPEPASSEMHFMWKGSRLEIFIPNSTSDSEIEGDNSTNTNNMTRDGSVVFR